MLRILASFGKTKSCSFTNLNKFQYSMPYYAVAAGWEAGIFDTWPECETKVKGFSKPIYKKFKTKQEAEDFLKTHGVKLGPTSSNVGSYNPRHDAVPLAVTPKKETKSELNGLVKKKTKNLWESTAKKYETGSKVDKEIVLENEVDKEEILDVWPDDVDLEEDDDEILLAAVAEVEGIPENPLKRKTPFGTTGDGLRGSKVLKKYSHESKVWEPIGLKTIGNFEFPIDSEGFVIVYTDGSCINNGQAGAVAGYGVYFSENHPLNAGKPVIGRVTNNAGEIQASIHAIRIAKDFGIRKLCLSTDSQFLINAVTAWMKNWKRKGWKLKGGEPVKNKEDFEILDNLLDGSIEIKWNYVKGHKGIIGNEKADQLAREGAALYKLNKKHNKS